MISVTAAAHGFRRTSKPMGTYVKAYGSGRLPMTFTTSDCYVGSECEGRHADNLFSTLRKAAENCATLIIICRFLIKLWNIICGIFKSAFPFFIFDSSMELHDDSEFSSKFKQQISSFETLEDKLLLKIFRQLDVHSLLSAGSTCKRWHSAVVEKADVLAKFQTDQIKLYFDEGEVICVPVVSHKVPMRYVMPSVDLLEGCLRHISTSSLFVRGLIQIETGPVLRRLSRLRLNASQIYFLWCDFDTYAEHHLIDLFVTNVCTLSDIGFEVCTPASVITDRLIDANLPHLSSFRLWSESSSDVYEVTDKTLFQIADLLNSSQGSALETIDLARVQVTVAGITAVIQAWSSRPTNHLSMSFHHCGIERSDVVNCCRARNINISSKGLVVRGYQLTLYVC